MLCTPGVATVSQQDYILGLALYIYTLIAKVCPLYWAKVQCLWFCTYDKVLVGFVSLKTHKICIITIYQSGLFLNISITILCDIHIMKEEIAPLLSENLITA